MKDITILALDGTAVSSVGGPMDVFCSTGITWNRIFDCDVEPLFNVRVVSPHGRPVQCLNNVEIAVHGGMREVEQTDLIIISALVGLKSLDSGLQSVIDWLKDRYEGGSHIASICTGAFVLAETGLLDGKKATTHWGTIGAFRERYPRVRLDPNQIITDEGDLYCSAGATAAFDLTFYLVGKFCGREKAIQSAKALVHDLERPSQAPYWVFSQPRSNNDPRIKAAQDWIAENYPDTIRVSRLADEAGLSRRTFERRFKTATGYTPLLYVQKTRVEAAKHLLETSLHSFDEITYRVGYEDSSSFRKVFIKEVGVLPKAYRNKFRTV